MSVLRGRYQGPTSAEPIQNVRAFDLVDAALEAIGIAPLIAGDDWALRLQLRTPLDVAQNLTGCLLLFTVRETPAGAAIFTRRSDTDCTGAAGQKQIAIDAGQGSEVGNTGQGWFAVQLRHEEEATLLPIAALVGRVLEYDLRVRYSDNKVQTFLQGRFQLARPLVTPVS